MIQMATGRVIAQRVEESHHGIEVLVLPAARKANRHKLEARILWWWPQSEVVVVSRGHNVTRQTVSRREMGLALASRKAKARKSA